MSSPKEFVDASFVYPTYNVCVDLWMSLQNAIAGNAIVVFSKSWCPYCKRAKQLLKTEYCDVEPTIFEYV
jgi:thiol-disulfide isomerase/thioredoxin